MNFEGICRASSPLFAKGDSTSQSGPYEGYKKVELRRNAIKGEGSREWKIGNGKLLKGKTYFMENCRKLS